MSRTALWSLILWLVFLPLRAVSLEPVTTGTLIEEMTNMVRLADFPEPAYKTIQFSSYDRRSKLPGGPDWFANSDGFGGESIPNFEAVLAEPDDQGIGEYLMCDVRSPGAIVRMWTAAIEGRIRAYLDGAEEPVFDGPAREFLQSPYRRSAEAAGMDPEIFEATFRQRDACYFPIPFAKSCRIVWRGNVQRIHFYEIQIRCYDPATKVTTFQSEDLATYRSRIERIAKVLAKPGDMWEYQSSQEAAPIEATILPQQTAEVLALEGPQAIERITLNLAAKDLDRALRRTILHIVCDDYPWGQVQSPVGDFFGAAPGVNPFDSVPFTVRPDGEMTCRFIMPFAKSCKIRLENKGDQQVHVSGSILPVDYAWNDSRSMHFRARWRVDHNLVADGGSGVRDLPFVIANGAGVYVGTAVMLLNPNPIPTPWGSWWGEGDEKIFVDQDVQPSTFGTGSEDYFNYSWSAPDIFGFPYCGQPRDDGPANRGFVVNHRWHIMDAIPFRSRIAFYMELFSHERTPGLSYARIGYHYGRPGLSDDHIDISSEDVRHLSLPPDWRPAARFGASDADFYQAEDVLVDQHRTEFVANAMWAKDRLLVWNPASGNDELAFKLPVKQAGKYVIHMTAAFTPRSGKLAIRLDGKDVGFGGEEGIVDLEVPYRTLARTVSSERIELSEGDHVLSLHYQGKLPGDSDRQIGIDFFWVQKQR
ncbi:MAG: DUF2961 domain-containing protein [Pirellulales bacterium]|nr:DUF2961 domain-containing protein [Pirellulales bacterium]